MSKEMNQLENGKKLTTHERKDMFRRWIFNAGLGYNFETQQAPAVAFSMRKALRKIYPMMMNTSKQWIIITSISMLIH